MGQTGPTCLERNGGGHRTASPLRTPEAKVGGVPGVWGLIKGGLKTFLGDGVAKHDCGRENDRTSSLLGTTAPESGKGYSTLKIRFSKMEGFWRNSAVKEEVGEDEESKGGKYGTGIHKS